MPQARPDLVLVNPASRPQVYQSLAETLSAVEPPVWAGLMATYVRNQGFGVEIIDAEAEWLSCRANGPALPRSQARAGRRGGLRAPAFGLDADHAGRRRGVHGDEGTGSRAEGAAGRRARRRAARADAAGRSRRFRGRRRRARRPDRVAGGPQGRRRRPGEGVRPVLPRRQCASWPRPSRRRWCRISTSRCPASPGTCFPWTSIAPTTGTAWATSTAAGELVRSPYAAIYTTLGCPFKCKFCCIQAPFKSGEQELGMQATTNSYRYWSPQRVVDTLQHVVEHYGVRHVKFADEMFVLNPQARRANLRPDHRAGLGSQHLGLCPGRHGAAQDARIAQEGGHQLAGLRHRGRQQQGPRRRAKGVRPGRHPQHAAKRVGRRDVRHRQLHLRSARGQPRDHAGDPGPGHRPELRVRQLLLRHGVPGLEAARSRGGRRMEAARQLGRLLAALGRYAAPADALPERRRGLAFPRQGVPDLLHRIPATWTSCGRSSARIPCGTSGR